MSSSSSTGSSQNQQPVSSQAQEAGFFQNQLPRKCGIAALLAHITNTSETHHVRLCKEETLSKVSSAVAPEFGPRGDPSKDEKIKAKVMKTQASKSDDTCTHYNILYKR